MSQGAVVFEGQNLGQRGDPCVMVIFGAAGDLTRRKLIPSLYNLAKYNLLSREFAVIGIARNAISAEEFRAKVMLDLKEFVDGPLDPVILEWFEHHVHYVTGEFADDTTYQQLKDLLQSVDKNHNTHGNVFYYLATAPEFFGLIAERLAGLGLMAQENHQWRRVIVEKPFGHDLDSARALNRQLLKVVDEDQIYRIDHYLGKETVQNILAFRFANGIFEPIWNRRYSITYRFPSVKL